MSTERVTEIEAAASDWLIRRDAGAWTDEDRARFEAWLTASTLHRVAYLRLELAWEEAARLKALGAGIAGDQPPPRGEWHLSPFFEARDQKGVAREEEGTPVTEAREAVDEAAAHGVASVVPPGARTRRIATLALAASVLVAVALGAYRWLEPTGHRYSTGVGGLASVPLPDGSSITLNTATVVRVDLTEKKREVDLTEGEAFFQVAKDPTRPFVVNVGGKRVIAVGTAFSVRREGDDVRVVVAEGTVRMEDRRARSLAAPSQSLAASSSAGSADVVLLPAGSVAHAGEAGILVQRKSVPEAQEELSWRTGILMFRDETLADAVAEFNRYNARQIVVSDPSIAALKIEGNFRATNVDAFVRLLREGFPVQASTEGDQIVLSAPGSVTPR